MYKIIAQDITGQQLDHAYIMVKPSERVLNSFIKEVKRQFRVLVKLSVVKLKYIDMGV